MKKLIFKLLFVAVVLLALLAAPSLIGQKGYVQIAMGNLIIETSVVAVGIMAIGVAVIWIIVRMLFSQVGRYTRLSGSWFGNRAQRKRQRAFYRSIQALAEGDYDAATQAADTAEEGEFEGVNYLVSAQVAVGRGRDDTAARKLAEAAQFPSSALAARVMLARMALAANQPTNALAELDKLNDKQKLAKPAILLRIQALADSGQWSLLESELERGKKVLGEQYAQWSKQIAKGRLSEVASKQGAIQLKQYWQSLPRRQRNDLGYQTAYAEQLLQQGMHEEAQNILLGWQKRGPNQALLPLLSKLTLPNPAPTMNVLESWIKHDEDNPQLYFILGQVAYHANDMSLATKALQKSMKLKPSQRGLLLLAEINEKTNDHESALKYYKQSLALNQPQLA